MYKLSDEQIDFILADIRARGVEMEDLQNNLLDHICCIIERDLQPDIDFETFYRKTIRSFYKDTLWEIEEETISLLTFKNFYTMKKLMILSGAVSAFSLAVGIWFKFMSWPGATLFVCVGMLCGSLLFLPLLFTLKAKEKQSTKDKAVMALGALGVILVSLSFLSKVMHWPYSIEMIYLSAAIMLLVFLPIYFFSGIKKADTKLNTITTSMLVILVYGLLFMMIRAPRSALFMDLNAKQELSIGSEILLNELRLSKSNANLLPSSLRDLHKKIDSLCNESRSYINWRDIDTTSSSPFLEFNPNKRILTDPFDWDQTIREKVFALNLFAEKYNQALATLGTKRLSRIHLRLTLLDPSSQNHLSKASVLHQLNQIQLLLLQNNRSLLALN